MTCRAFCLFAFLVLFGGMIAPKMALSEEAWAQFFEAPGAQVETSADATREAVRLPGDVLLMRERAAEGWTYTGVDQSAHGAVGCIARILIEVNRVSQQCSALLNAENTERLEAHLGRIAQFYGAHAVPQTSADAFLNSVGRHTEKSPALTCSDVTSGFEDMAGQLTDPASTGLIDDLLSVPRLPVANPCL